ncbi:hypothetical protein MMC30_007041 [Trapelia coarctata]|nr:hypothetical protein [Trapelia coarctata]
MGNVLPSPRLALTSSLSPAELKALPYPLDFMPGARDVESPYGVMRAYEWGPEDGQKILFLHGLSTPGPALAGIGKNLAHRGCRVMILDLWGRGYSDTPQDLPHDSRLYATQILLAIATSSVSWTGSASGGFCLVGYSMGGGIAVAFAGFFPQLISSVVLMAPGGLYKSLPAEYHSIPLRLPWIFPSSFIKRFIKRLLNGTTSSACGQGGAEFNENIGLKGTTEASVPHSPSLGQSSGQLPVAAIVDWEVDFHQGFTHSIISAISYAPIENQYAAWRKLGLWLRGHGLLESASGLPNRLQEKKVLLLVGESDTILMKDHICKSAADTLGAENIIVIAFDGGHDFPIVQAEAVAGSIGDFLGL